MDDSDSEDDRKSTNTKSDKSKASKDKEPSVSKKRRVLYSSDEDEPKPKPKSKDTLASKASKLKTVDANNPFGSAPVKRIEKEKKPKLNVSIDVFDADTDDMELMQVDDDVVSSKPIKQESSQNEHKKKKDEKHTPKKENGVLKTKNDKTPEKIKTEKKSPIKEEKHSPKKESKKSPDSDHSAKKKSRKTTSSSKKPKPTHDEEELDRSVYDPDQEKMEIKRATAMLYHQRQKRTGPSNPNSKEIPKGNKNCLDGLTFVLTGEYESMERDEAKAVIEEHGGRVTSAVSGKTKYIVAGDEAGPAKLAKAQNMNIPVLSEDDLLDLIRVKSGMPPLNPESQVAETTTSPKKEAKTSPKDKKASKSSHKHDERAHSSGSSGHKETVTKVKTEKVEVMDVKTEGKISKIKFHFLVNW